ncbi:hypothetical protein LK03_19705 [Pseudomonas cremoricolorata]|uniref:Uncharacterized protein n=1 Tax=Pseudomonas cremoricolorata TaxID=157783 RepID=A0A089WRY0_9PSED|nr:hypothetical protein LK03_19705 [Pseudomonas cremoricolorata]
MIASLPLIRGPDRACGAHSRHLWRRSVSMQPKRQRDAMVTATKKLSRGTEALDRSHGHRRRLCSTASTSHAAGGSTAPAFFRPRPFAATTFLAQDSRHAP